MIHFGKMQQWISSCIRFLFLVYIIVIRVQGKHNLEDHTTSLFNYGNETLYEIETEKSGIEFPPIVMKELANLNAPQAARRVIEIVTESIQDRITRMFQLKAKSGECRAKIGKHFSYWMNAIGREDAGLPFVGSKFLNTCPEPRLDFNNLPKGTSFESIMYKTYQPSKDEAEYIKDKRDLKILYGILMHGDDARGTIRLIEALYEEGHSFVIHVDGKPENEKAYDSLLKYSQDKSHVYIVPRQHRVRVNWGGYSMVNATMQMLKYSFALLDDAFMNHGPLDFHKFVHLSASSYPLKSNTEIRERIASFPLDANMMLVIMKPLDPHPSAFHYYVECDDAVHRIYRMPPLTASTHGVDLYTSSQWFIISRDFASYLARAEPGTFVHEYIQYAKHVVVADETFFGTVLRNTEYCIKHHNDNFLHLQFDRWESDMQYGERDERKCLSPDLNRCGRSPTTLTVDDYFALELSNQLFARKFSSTDTAVLDLIDEYRAADERKFRDIAAGNFTPPPLNIHTTFENQGTLIVIRESVNSSTPLCVGLGMSGHHVKLVPCFHNVIVPTLAKGWETGAVIEEEVLPNNRWEVGPCSSDGFLKRRRDTAQMESRKGRHSSPHCMIKLRGGSRNGRCLDIQGERIEPGGQIQVYPCIHKWHQMYGFGDGTVAPVGSLHGSIPKNILNTILQRRRGKDQAPHLCLGVSGRGGKRYIPWEEDENRVDLNHIDFVPWNDTELERLLEQGQVPPIELWQDKLLVTVPCSGSSAAVLEFLFVPFVLEEEEDVHDEPKASVNIQDEL